MVVQSTPFAYHSNSIDSIGIFFSSQTIAFLPITFLQDARNEEAEWASDTLFAEELLILSNSNF
jgi:hypothetical protein